AWSRSYCRARTAGSSYSPSMTVVTSTSSERVCARAATHRTAASLAGPPSTATTTFSAMIGLLPDRCSQRAPAAPTGTGPKVPQYPYREERLNMEDQAGALEFPNAPRSELDRALA